MTNLFSILFHKDFTQYDVDEMRQRGYILHVVVELNDKTRYMLEFTTAFVLQQEFDYLTSLGYPCLSYAGIVIVEDLTIQAIYSAIPQLIQRGFFKELKVLGPNEYTEISQIIKP